jgi:Zinc finger, C2H2 type
MTSRKIGYSKMYMIPPSTWEFVKQCVDNLEAQRLEQLNKERNVSQVRSRSDQILSNISSRDIKPITESMQPEVSITSRNLSPIPESMSESYYINPSEYENVSQDIPMVEPPSDFATQTEYPTESYLVPSPSTSLQVESPIVTYPPDSSTETTIPRITNLRGILKPKAIPFKKTIPIKYSQNPSVTFKKPLPVTFKKPITYATRKRKANDEYIQPISVNDPFIQTQPTQDYNISNISNDFETDSFGILPPPEYRSQDITFDPQIHSTPIASSRRLNQPKPSRIPIPILPLPSCTPKITTVSRLPRRTLSTIESASKSAISKPQPALTYLGPKSITTKIKPQITYSGIQTRAQSKKAKALTYSPIKTRSVTKTALVKADSYICPLCGIEFTTQVNMERHMRVLHNATARNYDKWKK